MLESNKKRWPSAWCTDPHEPERGYWEICGRCIHWDERPLPNHDSRGNCQIHLRSTRSHSVCELWQPSEREQARVDRQGGAK